MERCLACEADLEHKAKATADKLPSKDACRCGGTCGLATNRTYRTFVAFAALLCNRLFGFDLCLLGVQFGLLSLVVGVEKNLKIVQMARY